MLLTQEEARKETCPFIRYCTNESRVFNDREPAIYAHQNCMGADCKIGWRAVGGDGRGFCGAFGRSTP